MALLGPARIKVASLYTKYSFASILSSLKSGSPISGKFVLLLEVGEF
jgi:hypothetical protein